MSNRSISAAVTVALLFGHVQAHAHDLQNAVDPPDTVNEPTTTVVGGAADGIGKNVLIYEEFTLGTSAYITMLEEQVIAKGWSFTLVNDGFAFQAELQNPIYDHVIAAHQDTFGAGTWDQGVGTGGLADWALSHPEGQVLISDWRVNNPQPYLAALGFGYTGNTNLTNVTGLPGTILAGIDADLGSPGWGIFSYGVTGPQIIATDGPTGKPIAAQNNKWYFNGFLSDTFLFFLEDGVEVARREIKKTVPDPSKGACCFESGACAVLTPDECVDAGGDYQGDETICVGTDCPQPRGACCFEDGLCEELTADECAAAGGQWQGPGTVCSPNPCPQPAGACCYEDGWCTYVTEERCVTTSGDWQGPGLSCKAADCPQPRGACCFPNGDCDELTQEECGGAAGVYQGAFTTCVDIDCTQPPGACCFEDGSCTSVTEERCLDAGGDYQGDGSLCAKVDCPQPRGACCFEDGSCDELTQAECGAAGGAYQGHFTVCALTECPPFKQACCFEDGSCTALTAEACEASGGSVQDGVPTCADADCPQPIGACCFVPTLSGACGEMTQDVCEASGGFYQGDGTTCSEAFCTEGACCFADGSCGVVGTVVDCEKQGGEYQGDLTTCFDQCEEPPGACCFESGDCTEIRQLACADNGGLYQGDFTSCVDADCPPLKLACCFADGSCAVVTPAECDDAGGAVQKDAGTCADVDCASSRSYTSEIVTREISDAVGPTVITIDVPDSGTIASVKSVDLIGLTHTWAGDLTITLEHEGVTVTLLDRPGVPESSFGDSSDFDGSVYTWVEGGVVYDAFIADPVPSDLQYGPIPPSVFADFVGHDKFGPWTLTITDAAGGDDGTIDGFRLTMNNGKPATGACCLPDGSCFEEVEARCVLTGGTYQGGSTCALITCVKTFCTSDIAGAGNAPDGVVDFQDLLSVVSDWGTCERCPSDLDGDGVVGFIDLVTLLGAWGPCSG